MACSIHPNCSARMLFFMLILVSPVTYAAPSPPSVLPDGEIIRAAVEKQLSTALSLYQWFHAHPELSNQEQKTAARLAQALRQIGLHPEEKVGGHGVIATLSNGSGRHILYRADMDALPVTERELLRGIITETDLLQALVTAGGC